MCFANVFKDKREYTRINLYEPCSEILEDGRGLKEMAKAKIGDKEIGFQAHFKGLNATFNAQTELRSAILRDMYEVATTDYWVRLDCEKEIGRAHV